MSWNKEEKAVYMKAYLQQPNVKEAHKRAVAKWLAVPANREKARESMRKACKKYKAKIMTDPILLEKKRARDRQYFYKRDPIQRSAVRKKHDYGITLAEWEAMLAHQGKRCAICRTDDFGKQGPCVDHDHITTYIRGLLCATCNRMLGNAKDNIFILKAAINYLLRTNTWYEKDMPEKLRQMSIEQTQLDSLEGGQCIN